MSTNYEHNGEDDTLAARRTAHALGQTSGEDWAAVERELAASPQAQQEVEAIAAMGQRLKEAVQLTPPAVHSPDLRAAVEERLTALDAAAQPAVRGSSRRQLIAWVASAAAVALVAVTVVQSMKFPGRGEPRQVAQSPALTTFDGPNKNFKEVAAITARGAQPNWTQRESAEPALTAPSATTWQSSADSKRLSGMPPPSAALPLYSDVVGPQGKGAAGNASSTYSLQMTYDPSRANIPSDGYLAGQSAGMAGNQQYGRGPTTVQTVTGTNAITGATTISRLTGAGSIESGSYGGLGMTLGANALDTGDKGEVTKSGEGRLYLGGTNNFSVASSTSHGDVTPGAWEIRPDPNAPSDNKPGSAPYSGVTLSGNSILNVTGGTLHFAGGLNGREGPEYPHLATAHAPARQPPSQSKPGDGATSSDNDDALLPDNARGLIANSTSDRQKIAPLNMGAAEQEHNAPPLQADGKPAVVSAARDAAIARNDQGFAEEKARIAAIERDYGERERLAAPIRRPAVPYGDEAPANGEGKPGESTETALRQQMLQSTVDAQPPLLAKGAKPSQMYAHAIDELEATKQARMGMAGSLKDAMASAAAKPKPQITSIKKPLETWKPARVVPNASRLMVGDKEELPLKGMQVDVRVDGFRARVLLDLYYFNDRPQQLEGNFQLRLPDEAAPYFFAFGRTVYQAPQVTPSDSMFFKPQQVSLGDTTPEKILALRDNSWEQPKVARMVPKEKAAMAYRDMVRRRIDPALVEWSGAGVFQCRVFPLAPQSLHRVTIGYDVDLVRVGDDLELRLDLPEWQSASGVAPATVVDLNVAAAEARQVSLDSPATQSPDGRRLAYRLIDPKDRPITLRLRKPGTLLLTGNDEATGNYFATRATLPLPESGAGSGEQGAGSKAKGEGRGEKGDRADRAVFLVDTSLSAGPQFPLWTKMLRATLTNNRDKIKQFAVLFFNVETFWWQEKYVDNTPENVEAVLSYADNLALEGATDLGRALQEAAAPKWRKAEDGTAPDLFLLSDGAATWGEDRWGLLAAAITGNSKAGQTALTPSPSPKGRGEEKALTASPSSELFAYRTGLAGGDSRLLGYLAERTGGAVFSLFGEAEIATASVAHRNRPWKLTGLEMAGAHDVLVAGRPQYVYPGQQLTIVGRLESPLDGARKINPPNITFTLQQGSGTQTVKVAMEQVIPSELAGRTFGQVATNQLEDVAGVEQSAEPVATAYARHFRITGRTCSLLMLESEQDYARFNIRPEEDDFVVKQRPADPIVIKAIADTVAAMSDPKTNFLAWYNRLAASEVRFDLPASLKVYLDGLPEETFAVVPQPLVCKLRRRGELPENLQQPWQTGMADYDTLDAEAQRRLTTYGADDALRCLSSLVEERPGDTSLARDLAFTAIDWQRPGEAYHLLRRAAAARTFEPITFHAMAHCLEQMGRADLAIVYYELACGGQWDQRFGDMHNIAMLDYARFLRRVVVGKGIVAGYAQSRLATLDAMNLRDTADVAALIFWNTDGTDVDLHVVEPSGEECFYQHTQTASGGHISRDVTTGYGPELYLLPKAPSGRYEISAHYFATDANRASTRTKVLAFIYENWGAKDEHVAIKSLALNGQKEKHELGVVKR
jgi:hypothetical protein